MFQITKVLCTFSKNSRVVRKYNYKKIVDPGIAHRKDFLAEQNYDDLDEAELDQLESDFMNVHKSHKEHLSDINNKREQLKYHIVKSKYFKQHYPNFLTWNEKEQIKYLHNKNPEEWSVEILSESFPASPEIINKIIKAKYNKNASKIASHDKTVQENWKSYKRGQITNLPPELELHLKKFMDRSKNIVPLEIVNKKKEIVNKSELPSVFSEINTTYEALKNKNNKTTDEETKETNLTLQNKNIYTSSKSHNYITLKELKNKLMNKFDNDNNLSCVDKALLKTVDYSKEKSTKTLMKKEIQNMSEMKYQTNDGSNFVEKSLDYSHLLYPLRIKIPNNKLNKDCVYKLNDCYYDYDGLFLYRVPGMDK